MAGTAWRFFRRVAVVSSSALFVATILVLAYLQRKRTEMRRRHWQPAIQAWLAAPVRRQENKPIKGTNVLRGACNFRDVAALDPSDPIAHKSVLPVMRKGVVFRSGELDEANEDDKRDLTVAHGIRTWIDLRDPKRGRDWRLQAAGATASPRGRGGRPVIRRYVIPYQAMVVCMATPVGALRVMVLSVLGRQRQARELTVKYGTEFIQTTGLRGLYTVMLDFSARQFGAVLRDIARAERLPICINCNLGKDRTGVACALLALALGADDADIVKGYQMSEELIPISVKVASIKKEVVLGVEFSSCAPAPVMQYVLNWIRSRYGTVEEYLVGRAGLSMEDLTRLRQVVGTTPSQVMLVDGQ
mmetsp:Transcript_16342/g.37528  ORF Transcript_16342/g.37528 Transcript_16342/m.37528 type:complete len:359 (-) Transcript_16342:48-1124(-)|eukprot:CAMPEP_0204400888 /NCGR_PEP_ID=MMETSP0470-20130426/4327_1 /ASSEMBLY_ACC=CAM_ASM_000385 /TAXON_ID=2969 /ORGANISM="Oxyrrhis marina" /LENGTH=358 /DNA_ID=CAMNT_0051395783 /DNA_START=43 /DNA_END=1119 /DNA_ORIENTATION=-